VPTHQICEFVSSDLGFGKLVLDTKDNILRIAKEKTLVRNEGLIEDNDMMSY
jgi:hypothetical protein